jgi:hypothetical protein
MPACRNRISDAIQKVLTRLPRQRKRPIRAHRRLERTCSVANGPRTARLRPHSRGSGGREWPRAFTRSRWSRAEAGRSRDPRSGAGAPSPRPERRGDGTSDSRAGAGICLGPSTGRVYEAVPREAVPRAGQADGSAPRPPMPGRRPGRAEKTFAAAAQTFPLAGRAVSEYHGTVGVLGSWSRVWLPEGPPVSLLAFVAFIVLGLTAFASSCGRGAARALPRRP